MKKILQHENISLNLPYCEGHHFAGDVFNDNTSTAFTQQLNNNQWGDSVSFQRDVVNNAAAFLSRGREFHRCKAKSLPVGGQGCTGMHALANAEVIAEVEVVQGVKCLGVLVVLRPGLPVSSGILPRVECE